MFSIGRTSFNVVAGPYLQSDRSARSRVPFGAKNLDIEAFRRRKLSDRNGEMEMCRSFIRDFPVPPVSFLNQYTRQNSAQRETQVFEIS